MTEFSFIYDIPDFWLGVMCCLLFQLITGFVMIAIAVRNADAVYKEELYTKDHTQKAYLRPIDKH